MNAWELLDFIEVRGLSVKETVEFYSTVMHIVEKDEVYRLISDEMENCEVFDLSAAEKLWNEDLSVECDIRM